MHMKKVLMIAYYFPPIAGAAAVRTLKFAKYLSQFGWKPVILTVRNPDRFAVKLDRNDMGDELGEERIFRSYSIPLGWICKIGRLGINYKWFFTPDPFITWLPSAFYLGKEIVTDENIDLIYALCPPATGLLVSALLKRVAKNPLVVEYQDLWIGNPFTSYPTRIHYNLEKKMEEQVLKYCDAIVTTTNCQKEELLNVYPFLEKTSVHIVTNGFDPKDFSDVKPIKYDKFTIVHTGTIYGPRVDHFKIFLKALHRLLQRTEVPDFQIVLVGSLKRGRKFIHELGLTSRVILLGQKSHAESVQFALGADALLLIPGSPSVVPIKLPEYLAAGKFILNISDPSGETARIIDQANAGITVKPDIFSVQKLLHEILILKTRKIKKNTEALKQFSDVELAKKLASIFDLVLKKSHIK